MDTRGYSQKKYQSKIMCFSCKRFGQYKSECRNKKRDKGNQYAQATKITNSIDEAKNTMLLTCNAVMKDQQNIQFLDLGSNNYICGQKKLFPTLDDTIRSKVKFGNNVKVTITGKGNINIIMRMDLSDALLIFIVSLVFTKIFLAQGICMIEIMICKLKMEFALLEITNIN